MTDILNLPDWKAIATQQEGIQIVIEADYTIKPKACQKCGVIDRLYRHGAKATTYRDSPIRGAPVNILANVQRYRCRDCGETFLQPLGSIQPDMRMTVRCVEYIKTQCLRDTFLRIAEHIGCDDKTVRKIAAEHIAALNLQFKPHLPEWLGIDETQIDGKLRCIITDVKNRIPIDMLPDRDKDSVKTWLNKFRDKRTVKGLAIDMWRPYKDAVETVFPGLPVVIDKFHLVKMANKAMDDVRIALAKDQVKAVGKEWMRRKALLRMRYKNLDEKGRFSLGMWLDNEPHVKTAYDLKEAFYDIYDAPSKIDAANRLDAWRASVPASMKKGKKSFAPLLTATKNWRTEMLAIFDFPISNGYTEALNGVAKVINRQGRGYSFDVLRARLLFSKVPVLKTPTEQKEAVTECFSCQGVFTLAEFEPETFGTEWGLCLACSTRLHEREMALNPEHSTP
jgi:transposase